MFLLSNLSILLFHKLFETTQYSVVAAQRKRSLRGCNTSPGGTIGARAEVAGVEVASCLLEDRGPKPPPLALYPPLWSRLPSLPQGDANATCFCFYVPCTGCMMEPVGEFWISKGCYEYVFDFWSCFWSSDAGCLDFFIRNWFVYFFYLVLDLLL